MSVPQNTVMDLNIVMSNVVSMPHLFLKNQCGWQAAYLALKKGGQNPNNGPLLGLYN
jgi:hypothetical protein